MKIHSFKVVFIVTKNLEKSHNCTDTKINSFQKLETVLNPLICTDEILTKTIF